MDLLFPLSIIRVLQYLAGFKRYSTERVMKSLVGEFTQNEKWSVKGALVKHWKKGLRITMESYLCM